MAFPLLSSSHPLSTRRLLICSALVCCSLAPQSFAATRKKKKPSKTAPVVAPAASISSTSDIVLGTVPPGALNSSASPTAPLNASAGVVASGTSAGVIIININGRTIESDPPPVLQKGSVLVPLRGVLENLGAVVTYMSAERRINIAQSGKMVTLKLGEDSAIADMQVIKLTAAPVEIGGRAFVPMRSLAEIFGYRVEWLPPTRTVSIVSNNVPQKILFWTPNVNNTRR